MDVHDYVPDPATDRTTCQRCGLPERNARHVTSPPATLPGIGAGLPRTGARHPETSRTAAATAAPALGTVRGDIVALIAAAPATGYTDDELEVLLGRTHQSVSAARNGLVNDGWLEAATWPTGKPYTRPTRSGNQATVWTLTHTARAAWKVDTSDPAVTR